MHSTKITLLRNHVLITAFTARESNLISNDYYQTPHLQACVLTQHCTFVLYTQLTGDEWVFPSLSVNSPWSFNNHKTQLSNNQISHNQNSISDMCAVKTYCSVPWIETW